jgi:hypothetical protein
MSLIARAMHLDTNLLQFSEQLKHVNRRLQPDLF